MVLFQTTVNQNKSSLKLDEQSCNLWALHAGAEEAK